MKQRKRAGELAQMTPDIGLGMLLRAADMQFNKCLRDELAKHGVPYSHFQHLWKLWQSDGLTQAELSRSIGVTTAASTSVLDALEGAGLIRRHRQERDRRKINVFLTKSGRAFEAELTEAATRVNRDAREGLSEAEIASLFRILGVVKDNLRRRSSHLRMRRAADRARPDVN
jgi:DNA-binding MarR family transcriptional regulator